MAINLISEPKLYQPGFNPIEFVFESTNYNQCEFTYIADIYINGAFSVRLKSFPEGINGYGFFRIERIIQDYLSFNFLPKVNDFSSCPESIASYYIEIRERYNSTADCNGLPVLQPVDLTTDLKYAWNGALQYEEYPVYSVDNYVSKTIFSKFLTNSPNGLKLKITDNSTLSFIQDINNPVYKMSLKTYGYNGSLIGDYELNNAFTTPTVPQLFLTVCSGPENINTSALGAVITGSVSYYDITMLDVSDIQVTEVKRFYVDLKCSNFRNYKFYWLSRLGGFDRFSFDMKSFKRIPISRSIYTKSLDANYNIGDRGDKVISIDAKNNYKMNTDWISEPESIWLEELFTSPESYIYEVKDISGTPPITGASCYLPPTFDITGAVHNADGTADIILTEAIPGSLLGQFFNYTGSGFSAIGASDSGTHNQLTGWTGTVYNTDIVSSLNAGALITGYLIPESGGASAVSLNISSPIVIPNGTSFTYSVTGGGSLGMPGFGIGKIISYNSGTNTYVTDISCTIQVGAIVSGTLSFQAMIDNLIPIVITSSEYEEKIKKNIKSIQYSIDCSASNKKNIQSF